MRIIHREDQEQREHVELSRDAAFADESDGRDRSAEPDILRNDYVIVALYSDDEKSASRKRLGNDRRGKGA